MLSEQQSGEAVAGAGGAALDTLVWEDLPAEVMFEPGPESRSHKEIR